MELKDTVANMTSSDYKARFKAEYQQTKIRYEKLKKFNNQIEAANICERPNTNDIEEPKHNSPYFLLRQQQQAMGDYLHFLELRAIFEGIDISC